jgi:dTDP-4-amino-4,6-dideoxygalactose transaminase
MNVPFLDLRVQYQNHKTEIDQAIKNVISETAFIKGKFVEEFENNYAKAYGVKHCLGVADGTSAIYIALKMLGIQPGDEVITAACTWISSSETITQAGAKPVFVDIEPGYFTIDPAKIEEKITKSTKAVIAVHLYGQAANIKAIKSICDKHHLFLIEDCAQSHFAEFEGQKAGTFGNVATFSFYPGKNLGAYGDAGAIITNNDDLAAKMRMYANHGALVKHQHEMEGINSRLDGLQAAILSVKIPHIHQWNELRLKNALYYTELLQEVQNVICPDIRANGKHIFHLYVLRVQGREGLQLFLKGNGIETQIHYPTPLPFLKAYAYLGHKKSDFPVSVQYQSQIISLPLYPELKKEQIEFVVSKIKEFYKK